MSVGIVAFGKNTSGADCVLLIRQISSVFGPYWSIPKGHPEEGESDKDAAIREVQEEAGVSVPRELLFDGITSVERYTIFSDRYGQYSVLYKSVVYFAANFPEHIPLPIPDASGSAGETDVASWVPLPEALASIEIQDTRSIVQNFYDQMQK